MNINEEIEILKTKINVELYSLGYHKDFAKYVEQLRDQVNNPRIKFYDNPEVGDLDDLNLRAYKGYLQAFLEHDIKEINRIISEGKDNIFDDRSPELFESVQNLETEIDKVLSYLEEKLPFMKEEAMCKYNQLREKFYPNLDDSFKSNEISLRTYLGLESEPSFSVYGTSSSFFEEYLRELEIYKNAYIDKLSRYVEIDKKIRETIAIAKETFSDPEALNAIDRLEQNYVDNLEKCITNFNGYKDFEVIALQKEMLNRAINLDEYIAKMKSFNEYSEYLNSITFKDYDIDKLLEIEKYVNKYDTLEDEFYQVLYMIIEKDKRAKDINKDSNSIYDRLSPETKIKLERLFVERFSLLDESQIKETMQDYKTKGYIGVKDRSLDSFFENVSIKNTVLIIENIPEVKKLPEIKWLEHKEIDQLAKKMENNNPKDRKKIEKASNNFTIRQIDSNMYVVCTGKKQPFKYYYFDGEGNKLDLPDNKFMTQHAFNCFMNIEHYFLHLYDEHFNPIYKSDEESYGINCTRYNRYFVIREMLDYRYAPEERVKVFDENGKLLYKGDITDVMKLCGIDCENYTFGFLSDKCRDGIIIAKILNEGEDSYHYYVYNLNNKKILDERKDENDLELNWFNGRLPFRSAETNLYGFKDYDGNVVIEPKYISTSGFSGDLAFVSEMGTDGEIINYLIDKYDNKVDYNYPDGVYNVGCDPDSDRLCFTQDNKEIRSIRSICDYRIDIDKPILEYLGSNEEVNKTYRISPKH